MLKFLLPSGMALAMVAFVAQGVATPVGNPQQNTYANAPTKPDSNKARSSSNSQHFVHSTIKNPNSQRSWNGSGSNNAEQKPNNGAATLKDTSAKHAKSSQQK